MSSTSWKAFYQGDLQSVYALLIAPASFLLYRVWRGRPAGGVLPAATAFVDTYAIVFAFETIADPIVNGPLWRTLGLGEGAVGTAALLVFVLLGDFRVFLLAFGLLAIARGGAWTAGLPAAIGWTFVVPIAAYALDAALHAAVPGLDPNAIWLVYESLFVGLALTLRARLVPARVPASHPALRRFLDAVFLYVAGYYALWVAADVLIQVAGIDAGWLLRAVPNQLYYGLWVPLVFAAFFSRAYAATSASTQAAR